jgi:hypothetical protein
MATIARHQEISKRFLDQASEELGKGDLLQASEKAWGALSHFLESVAKEQGWLSRSHLRTNNNARRLIELTSEPRGNMDKLGVLNALHANFYADFYSEELVAHGIEAARELLADLEEAARRLPAEEVSDS